jgi:hypothetical protein
MGDIIRLDFLFPADELLLVPAARGADDDDDDEEEEKEREEDEEEETDAETELEPEDDIRLELLAWGLAAAPAATLVSFSSFPRRALTTSMNLTTGAKSLRSSSLRMASSALF